MTTETTTKSWGAAKAPQQSDRREILRLKFSAAPTEEKVRLIGNVMPRYVRWVTTKEGKKVPVECLSFNRETESFDSSLQDPFNEIPEAVYSDKPQFAYVCNVIHRADKLMKLFDLKRTIFKQIFDYAHNPEFGDPADESSGYDLTVVKEKTGPLAQNVKYNIIPARNNSPLTEEEKELQLYDLDAIHKTQSYADQKQWLMQNTNYFDGLGDDELRPESAEDL